MGENGRKPDGTFAAGNRCAVGNKGGRPTNAARRVIDELLHAPEVYIHDEDGKPIGQAVSLVEKARITIDNALSSTDKDGNTSYAALMAARDIFNRAFGLPKATMDLRVSNTDTLIDDLNAAEQQAELDELNEANKPGRLNGKP